MGIMSLFSGLFPALRIVADIKEAYGYSSKQKQQTEPAATSTHLTVKNSHPPIEGPNPFEKLPPEIITEIFSRLEVESLKSCRLVCHQWNRTLQNDKLFLGKICTVHQFSHGTASTKNFPEGTLLRVDHLRLRYIYSSKYDGPDHLFQWMNISSMSNVTHLDVRSTHLLLPHFMLIVNEFCNLRRLSIADETLIWTTHEGSPETHPEIHTNFWNTSKRHLRQITTLSLQLTSLHPLLRLLDQYDLLTFENLKELDLCGSSGLQSTFEVGNIIGKLFRRHSKSLRIVRFDQFSCQVKEQFGVRLISGDGALRSELYSEFEGFLEAVQDWDSPEELEVLTLDRFAVGNMCNPRVTGTLVPFLRKMIKLKELRLSQVYFSSDANIFTFTSHLPSSCKIYMTSTHLHAPITNFEDIAEVVHANKNILKFKKSSVELKMGNLNWRIIYLTWIQLENTVVHQSLHALTKLRFNRLAFPIGDTELQLICRGAAQLIELHFVRCDLLRVTDSGLTGLSGNACARVRADKLYVIREMDFIGVSLSNLKDLRSIKLGNVGQFVTDASIIGAFQGLNELRNLTIYQEPTLCFSSAGTHSLKENKKLTFHYKKARLDDD